MPPPPSADASSLSPAATSHGAPKEERPPYPVDSSNACIADQSGSASAARSEAGGSEAGDEAQLDVVVEGRLAPFLTKLFNLVSAADTDDSVRWSSNGRSIVIVDPPRLSREVLPRFFKHNKLGTFTQQLYTYGFARRSNKAPFDTQIVFSHEHFRAGVPAGLHKIRRTIALGGRPEGAAEPAAPPSLPQISAAEAEAEAETEAAAAGDGSGAAEERAILTTQFAMLERTLASVESTFTQYREQTRHAMIAIGAQIAQRQPHLTALVCAVIDQPPTGPNATDASSAEPPPKAAALAEQPAPSASGQRATLRDLTAAAQEARESDDRSEDSCGGGSGSDDRCASDERCGSEGDGGDSEPRDGGNESNERSGSEDRGSDSEKSNGHSDGGRSGGSGSARGSAHGSAGAGSASSKATSSSLEPRSDVSERSGSSGGPTSASFASSGSA